MTVFTGVTMPETDIWERQFQDVPEYKTWQELLDSVDLLVADGPRPELTAALVKCEEAYQAWVKWLEGQGIL